MASLGTTPGVVAAEVLGIFELPDSLELAALAEDGVKTFDAALAVGQPAILADFLSYAASRVEVLAPGHRPPHEAVATARGLLSSRLSERDGRSAEDFLNRALELTTWSAPADPTPGEFGALARGYLALILQGRSEDARALVLDARRHGISLREVLVDVLESAQREIGRRWQIGEISIAQEHYCTAVTQMVLTDLYPSLFAGTATTRRLVAAEAPGSLHQVGLRMVVDLLQCEGWDTKYLGPATPEQVVDSLAEHQAVVLAISASMPSQIAAVSAMIATVRADPRTREVKVLVGGRPFAVAPDLVALVGADACALSAADAVTACDQLSQPQA